MSSVFAEYVSSHMVSDKSLESDQGAMVARVHAHLALSKETHGLSPPPIEQDLCRYQVEAIDPEEEQQAQYQQALSTNHTRSEMVVDSAGERMFREMATHVGLTSNTVDDTMREMIREVSECGRVAEKTFSEFCTRSEEPMQVHTEKQQEEKKPPPPPPHSGQYNFLESSEDDDDDTFIVLVAGEKKKKTEEENDDNMKTIPSQKEEEEDDDDDKTTVPYESDSEKPPPSSSVIVAIPSSSSDVEEKVEEEEEEEKGRTRKIVVDDGEDIDDDDEEDDDDDDGEDIGDDDEEDDDDEDDDGSSLDSFVASDGEESKYFRGVRAAARLKHDDDDDDEWNEEEDDDDENDDEVMSDSSNDEEEEDEEDEDSQPAEEGANDTELCAVDARHILDASRRRVRRGVSMSRERLLDRVNAAVVEARAVRSTFMKLVNKQKKINRKHWLNSLTNSLLQLEQFRDNPEAAALLNDSALATTVHSTCRELKQRIDAHFDAEQAEGMRRKCKQELDALYDEYAEELGAFYEHFLTPEKERELRVREDEDQLAEMLLRETMLAPDKVRGQVVPGGLVYRTFIRPLEESYRLHFEHDRRTPVPAPTRELCALATVLLCHAFAAVCLRRRTDDTSTAAAAAAKRKEEEEEGSLPQFMTTRMQNIWKTAWESLPATPVWVPPGTTGVFDGGGGGGGDGSLLCSARVREDPPEVIIAPRRRHSSARTLHIVCNDSRHAEAVLGFVTAAVLPLVSFPVRTLATGISVKRFTLAIASDPRRAGVTALCRLDTCLAKVINLPSIRMGVFKWLLSVCYRRETETIWKSFTLRTETTTNK